MYRMYDIQDKKSLIEAISNYIHFYNYQRYQSRFESKRMEAIGKLYPKQYPTKN